MVEPIDRLMALAERLGLRVEESIERPRTGGVLSSVDVFRNGKLVGSAWAIGFGAEPVQVARNSAARDLLPVGG